MKMNLQLFAGKGEPEQPETEEPETEEPESEEPEKEEPEKKKSAPKSAPKGEEPEWARKLLAGMENLSKALGGGESQPPKQAQKVPLPKKPQMPPKASGSSEEKEEPKEPPKAGKSILRWFLG